MLTFNTIATLRNFPHNTIATNESCNLLGYNFLNDGGGGFFYYDNSNIETDNGGSIIKPNSLLISDSGRWVRQFQIDDAVNVNWFGVFPNNTDSSVQLTKLIDYYKYSAFRFGIKVLFPKPSSPNNQAYVLKNITVNSGFTFSANQSPVTNLYADCPVLIRPASGAATIFSFATDSRNATLENLFIIGNDIDDNLVTSLTAAVKFEGNFNTLKNNNIILCAKHAVLCNNNNVNNPNMVGCRIENNNLQGLKNSALSYPSYLGTLHIIKMGDSYLINNEIGSNSNVSYGTFKNLSRFATAMYADILSTSVINGNIFENADIGVYWTNSVYNSCSGNRYEYNGGGGLYLVNTSLSTFNGERFTNNAMVRANPSVAQYDDLTIDANSSNNTFIATVFANVNPGPSPFGKAPRYHITNFRDCTGAYQIRFVAPYCYLDVLNPTNCINQTSAGWKLPKLFAT